MKCLLCDDMARCKNYNPTALKCLGFEKAEILCNTCKVYPQCLKITEQKECSDYVSDEE